jgi:hypothetical protein
MVSLSGVRSGCTTDVFVLRGPEPFASTRPAHTHSREGSPVSHAYDPAMKPASQIVATVYFAVVGLLLIWSGWLLATADPDGGRHPVGALVLTGAVLGAVLGVVTLRRSRRP